MNADSPITSIGGIGKVKAANYKRMGIERVGDLLYHYPRGYEDRGDVKLLCDAPIGEKASFLLTVATSPRIHTIRRGMSLLKFRAYDESSSCEITFFNQNYHKDTFLLGSEYRFYGVAEKKGNKYFMSSPAFEACCEDNELLPLVPVYPLTEGISRNQISKDVSLAISKLCDKGEAEEYLPKSLLEKNRLCSLSYALKSIHFPRDYVSLAAAKKRLIYDEFLTFALGISLRGRQNRQRCAPPCADVDITPFTSRLPYALTDAQQRVCDDIAHDMSSGTAMSRIVIGDVGSGKTVCAAAAMYIAVKNGRQAALMVPTEILARQHYADIKEIFEPLGISCALLCGSLTQKQKKSIVERLGTGEVSERIDVVIGTHAILSDGVFLADPGIVVTDEQHRFGVSQRSLLLERNNQTNMLVMSATPIPRSLALTLYGDLNVSRIDKMPPGRQKVDTFAVNESYRARLDAFIAKQVDDGGQVYIVCPSIEENEDEEGRSDLTLGDVTLDGQVCISQKPKLKAASTYAEELKKRLPQLNIGLIHGKLKAEQKDSVMLDFSEGRIDVLVSTTVIEVGVNVPNASLMIVENAERFGLSQLHQLRGRVGRGKRKSYCVLVSESAGKDSTAGQRLSTMQKTNDGYVIAEKDLEMRGPGDFIRSTADEHVRQSGGIRFKLGELCDDTGLLKLAFGDAAELVSSDSTLSSHPTLYKRVREMFLMDESTQIN